ncbi:glutaminase a [Pelomyxa schiedti]|nr:glutaminase a [Pelomyxa schiedti]
MVAMRIGTNAQDILGTKGDYVGIDWGYMYAATEDSNGVTSVISDALSARNTFISSGALPTTDDNDMPRKCNNDWPTLAFAWSFTVGPEEEVSRYVIVAYDDIYSVKYFGTRLKPYWTNKWGSIESFILYSWSDMKNVLAMCDTFDQNLITELTNVGGEKFATIASLAYRQTFAAGKMVWDVDNSGPWYVMKEISSNGDFSTVDVIFPASPLFAWADPELLRLLLLPILMFANNETTNNYAEAWAPHHLGTYPIADIRTGEEEDMPVEETGNMLMMIALVTKLEGKFDSSFDHYWSLLIQWADYLISSLPDTANQLCTDDFEVKGIVALGAFSYVCQVKGDTTNADKYSQAAQGFVSQWLDLANPEQTDHYRLRYDEAGWSTKYNLLYQRLLGISVFPESVLSMETAYYYTQMNKYGFPLDCRDTFAKLDWEAWAATQSLNSTFFVETFDAIYEWANAAPDRVPLSDLYYTTSGSQYLNFRARPVVGGLFAPLLL